MKGNRLSYSIAILAVIGILAAFIGYTTDTPVASEVNLHSMERAASIKATTSTVSVTPAQTTTISTMTEKSCGCCAERKALTRERIQQARERRLARQSVTTNNATDE